MRRRILLLLPLLARVATGAEAPDGPWAGALPDARPVGEGTFRWFGLRVYDVRLWAPAGRYDPARPHVLALTYHVAIEREQFVDTSLEEMQRVAGPASAATLGRWRRSLQAAFPDVRAGDTLAGLHRPGEGCSFYDARTERARTDDVALAAAFFGIWLDPRTREPVLRRRLLGAAG